MKRTFFCLLAVLILAAACDNKDGKKPENFKLFVNGVDNPKKADGRRYAVRDTAMTSKEVLLELLQCSKDYEEWLGQDGLGWCGQISAKSPSKERIDFSLTISNIDTINTRLVFVTGNLEELERNVYINPNFAYDLTISTIRYGDGFSIKDTIAYIPNAQRRAAYEQIQALWDSGEWDEMYEIFENGLQFIPCTGEQYRMLEAQGLN